MAENSTTSRSLTDSCASSAVAAAAAATAAAIADDAAEIAAALAALAVASAKTYVQYILARFHILLAIECLRYHLSCSLRLVQSGGDGTQRKGGESEQV